MSADWVSVVLGDSGLGDVSPLEERLRAAYVCRYSIPSPRPVQNRLEGSYSARASLPASRSLLR